MSVESSNLGSDSEWVPSPERLDGIKSLALWANALQAIDNDESITKDEALAIATECFKHKGILTVMLRAEAEETRYLALHTIGTLCSNSVDFRDALATKDVHETLLQHLASSKPGSKLEFAATRALLSLFGSQKVIKALAAAFLPGFLERLPLLLSSPDERTVTRAAMLVHNLIMGSANRARLAASDVSMQLMAKLTMSKDKEAQAVAAGCLELLLRSARALPSEGILKVIIAALVRLIIIRSAKSFTSTEGHTSTRSSTDTDGHPLHLPVPAACNALHNIMRRRADTIDAIHQALERVNAGPALVQMADDDKCVGLLCNLLAHRTSQIAAVVNSGGIEKLVDVMLHAEAENARGFAALCLKTIVSELPEYEEKLYVAVSKEELDERAEAVLDKMEHHRQQMNECAMCGIAAGQSGVVLSKCSRCGWVAYCSAKCQRKHWKEHQGECFQMYELR